MKKALLLLSLLTIFVSASANATTYSFPARIITTNISPSLTLNRTTGYYPLSVMADMTGTTDVAETSLPFHEIAYYINWGDGSAGSWGDGAGGSGNCTPAGQAACGAAGSGANGSRNTQCCAPIAGHVYYAPGTYTITVTYINGLDWTTKTASVSVYDWANPHAGDTIITKCFGNSTPTAGVGGCPATAIAQPGTTSWTAVLAAACSYCRLLVNGGDHFDTPNQSNNLTVPGPGIITSYGSGQASIRNSGSNTFSTMITFTATASVAATDWRLDNVELDGADSAIGGDVTAITAGGYTGTSLLANFLSLTRLWCHDVGGCVEVAPNNALNATIDSLTLADSSIYNLVAISSDHHGILAAGTHIAVMGNLMNKSDGAGSSSEHMIRMPWMDHGIVNNNWILQVNTGKGLVDIRAPCYAPCASGSGNYFPNAIPVNSITGEATTFDVVVSSNLVDLNGTAGGIDLDGANTLDPVEFYNTIIEDNYVRTQTGGNSYPIWLRTGPNYSTIRNNLLDTSAGTLHVAVNFDTTGATNPAPLYSYVYSNSVYDNVSTSIVTAFNIPAPAIPLYFNNNIAWAPNASASSHVLSTAAVNSTVSPTNSNTTQLRQVTNPYSGTPSTSSAASVWILAGGSYAAAPAGTANVPVWSNFGGTPTPPTARTSWALGAQ